jgi:UDP-N-acetyl-D-mannosaminuronate dehydrogenase
MDFLSSVPFPGLLKKDSVTVEVTAISLPPTPPPERVRIDSVWESEEPTTQNKSSSPLEPSPIVAVIGVGYVGTHLVEAFAHHYNVVAFDLSEKRLLQVAEQMGDLPIQYTFSASDISQASHFLISVPTLLNNDKTIDTTYLRSAIATVEQYARPGSTIVIESSVAVGMTRTLVGPLMASKNFKVGMSPEVSFSHIPMPECNTNP